MHTDLNLHWQTLHSLNDGPRLIITGAVHGIETCGAVAIARLQQEIADGRLTLRRGMLTLIAVTNPLAYRQQTREGEGDLNRKLKLRAEPQTFEERLANQLCPLLLQHDALLDLHSFQSPGQAFVVLGPDAPFGKAQQEVELARHLGVSRFVEGSPIQTERVVPPETGASMANFMRAHGKYGVTLECGQHLAADAPEIAYQAIRNTLALFGLIDAPAPAPTAAPLSVRFRQTILRRSEADRFAKPWQSFDAVRAGELVGTFGDGEELRADRDGYLLFPDPLCKVGAEWIYFCDRGNRFDG